MSRPVAAEAMVRQAACDAEAEDAKAPRVESLRNLSAGTSWQAMLGPGAGACGRALRCKHRWTRAGLVCIRTAGVF